jgi:anti-sigma-K factor RskA
MSNGSHVVDLLPAYALGSLEDSEARQVAAHVAACAACRAELAELEAVGGLLALGVAEAEPSASVRQRLMERAPQRRPLTPAAPARAPHWTQRPVWTVASLLVIAALVISNALLWQRLQALGPEAERDTMHAVALHNTGLTPGASGYVLISPDGANGAVVVDALTPLDEAQAYQLWLERDGQITSGVVFTVDESGYRGARITAPDSLLSYTTLKITIEPAAGSPTPTGQTVLDAVLKTP